MHELIYSELSANMNSKNFMIEEQSIFMPTIFELNCHSILIHDFDGTQKADALYGFSYSVISNQF